MIAKILIHVRRSYLKAALSVTALLPAVAAWAQDAVPSPFDAVRAIPGSLVIAGGGGLPSEIVDRFLALGGGENARLVVVTTASIYAGTEEMDSRTGFWREKTLASLDVLHTRSRDEANDPNFFNPLISATAVWFIGGNQNAITDAYLGTRTEEQFHGVLERGGVLGGTSAGAAIMSRVMIAGGREQEVHLKTGFGFAPGLIVDQHFRKRNRQARLLEALNKWPGHVGMGIDENTALVIRGGTAEAVGSSDVTITLGEAPSRPARMQSLPPGKPTDLVALGRAAQARLPTFAIAKAQPRKGTLMLVGQGEAPDQIRAEFIQSAGGSNASIIVVSAQEPKEGAENSISQWLKSAGATNVQTLLVRSRQDVESQEFLTQLAEAKGIWLSNGPIRQLIDTYLDSPIQKTLERLLDDGGVIAGSAAGAQLHGTALAAAVADDENDVLSEAYERGFGFLPCIAATCEQPSPQPSAPLAGLKARYPHLTGVELTDSTALIVRGSKMQVLGKNPVTILDRMPKDPADYPEFSQVQPGECYDLADRTRTAMTAEAGDQ